MLSGQLDGGDRLFQHLLLRLLQLEFQVDIAGGDERMDSRPARARERLRGAFDVERAAARQGRDLRPWELPAHGLHRLEVAFRSDGETCLQDVHAKIHQLAGHPQLFRYGHAAPGRLVAVAQRGVEDVYAIAHDHLPDTSIMRGWGE